MKKIFNLIIITLCTFLLIGCGSTDKKSESSNEENNEEIKSLFCSQKVDNTSKGISAEVQVDAKFKSDKIQDLIMQMNVELDKSKKSSFDSYMKSIETRYKEQYKGDNVSVSVNKTDDLKFNIKIDMDFKNLTDEEKIKYGFGHGSQSYSLNKADLENKGYTCK